MVLDPRVARRQVHRRTGRPDPTYDQREITSGKLAIIRPRIRIRSRLGRFDVAGEELGRAAVHDAAANVLVRPRVQDEAGFGAFCPTAAPDIVAPEAVVEVDRDRRAGRGLTSDRAELDGVARIVDGEAATAGVLQQAVMDVRIGLVEPAPAAAAAALGQRHPHPEAVAFAGRLRRHVTEEAVADFEVGMDRRAVPVASDDLTAWLVVVVRRSGVELTVHQAPAVAVDEADTVAPVESKLTAPDLIGLPAKQDGQIE